MSGESNEPSTTRKRSPRWCRIQSTTKRGTYGRRPSRYAARIHSSLFQSYVATVELVQVGEVGRLATCGGRRLGIGRHAEAQPSLQRALLVAAGGLETERIGAVVRGVRED